MTSYYSCTELLSGLHSFVDEICSVPVEKVQKVVVAGINDYSAVCNGVTLTILKVSSDDTTIVSEVDFEKELVSVSWDNLGSCVVAGDSSGTLHLVLADGSLLFSKKLPIGESKFVSLQFLTRLTADCQSLLALLDNGVVLGISNLPIDKICKLAKADPKALGPVFQSLQFLKCALPAGKTKLIKGSAFVTKSDEASEVLNFVALDSESQVCVANLGDLSALKSPTEWIHRLGSSDRTKTCRDFAVRHVEGQDPVCFVLHSDHSLSVLNASSLKELTSFALDIAGDDISLHAQDSEESLLLISDSGKSSTKTQLLRFSFAAGSCVALNLGSRVLKTEGSTSAQTLHLISARGDVTALLSEGGSEVNLVRLAPQIRDLRRGLADTEGGVVGKCLSAVKSEAVAAVEDWMQHSESLFSQCSSCGEIVAVLNILLTVDQTVTDGLLEFLLSKAEAALDGLTSVRHNDPVKQRCLSHILKLVHAFETASELTFLASPHSSGGESESQPVREQVLREQFLSLLPHHLPHTVVVLLEAGHLRQLSLVAQRHLKGVVWPLPPQECLQSIPLSVSTEELTSFVSTVLVPSAAATVATSSAERSEVLLAISQQLCQRATELEDITNQPFDSLLLVELAQELNASLPLDEALQEEMQVVQVLHHNLRIQLLMWKIWSDKLSLREISTLGLESLVFDRLDSVEEDKLVEDVRDNVSLLLKELKGDLNVFLKKWIEDTVAHRIIYSGAAPEEDDLAGHEEQHHSYPRSGGGGGGGNQHLTAGETCTVSRLVLVLSLITDRNLVAMLSLVLFRIPSVENATSSIVATSLSADQQVLAAVSTTQKLCDIATSVCDYVDSSTRESLTEAMRLIKVKSLAVSYGIKSFDPRDNLQIRSAVSIIATSFERPTCLKDALQFASDWGHSNLELNSLITRAVLMRIEESTEGEDSELWIKVALSCSKSLNGMQVIAEDCLRHLLHSLEQVTDSIEYDPAKKVAVNATQVALKARAGGILKGALNIAAHFLDTTRDAVRSSLSIHSDETNKGAGSSTAVSKKAKPSEDSFHSWVNLSLHHSLKRLLSLQSAYDIFISLADLNCSDFCKSVLLKLAKARVAEVKTQDKELPLNSYCRKVCALLEVSPVYFSHSSMKLLVEAGNMPLAMAVASSLCIEKTLVSGATDPTVPEFLGGTAEHEVYDSAEDSSLLLDAAMTLCGIAAKKANQTSYDEYSPFPMASTTTSFIAQEVPEHLSFPVKAFELSRDVLKGSLASCQPSYVGKTLDLLSGSDLVLSVYERIEGATKLSANASSGASDSEASAVSSSSSFSPFRLSEGAFSKDGILMQPSVVVKPLMKHALSEVKRRSAHSVRLDSSKGKSTAAGSDETEVAPDLEELVHILQKSENHLLASRVLFCSWNAGANKAQMIRSSLLSLSRKILVYRDIDVPFAVACLAALPYDNMVRELKAAVPTIQNDFSRLQTVALVGEELSNLWDQEALLLVFQGLQTNARWWHILATLGVKVDLRIFQSPDATLRDNYIRSLIPDLLVKSEMDLEMVIEYCQQFDLEPECAVLGYIELLLKAAPVSTTDMTWSGKVRKAASRVEEKSLTTCLRSVLHQIHALDYEKICYICNWMVDILALEESANDGLNDDSSGDITNFSLNNTRQFIAAQQQHQSAAPASVSVEMETYRRYVGIASYLSGIFFPTDSTALLPGSAVLYAGVPRSYQERVPLWQLLLDPWTIIDPLLKSVPEIAMKFSPLCFPLQLDKNEFNVRRIKAHYTNMTSVKEATDASGTPSPYAKEVKKLSIQVASESISSTVTDVLQQVELWRWIYSQERGVDNDFAEQAIELAIAIVTSLNHTAPEVAELSSQLNSELLSLKCERTVKDFTSHLPDTPQVTQLLLSHLSEPLVLLKYILEVAVEVSWGLQLRSLLAGDDLVNCFGLTSVAPTHPVSEFLQVVEKTVENLSKHCGLDHGSPSAANGGGSNSPTSAQHSQVENIRHNLIGRMLADTEASPAAGDKEGASSASAAATASLVGKGLWSFAIQSNLSPTESELRRREDVYLSFAVACAVSTCSTPALRKLYVTQLDSVMRGKGARSMRRLTARSRFRAAQSLVYLRFNAANEGLFEPHSDLTRYQQFLYCLSEMQEIRLSCTEDSLMDALGLKLNDFTLISTATSEGNRTAARTDAKSLVRTWIHDEGTHVEVVELARDVQFITNQEDDAQWYFLLSHMLAKGQERVLLQTLTLLHKTAVFRELCFGLIGSEILQHVVKVQSEGVEKVLQMIDIHALRKTSCNVSDWLIASIDLDKDFASAGSPTTSSTSPNTNGGKGKRRVLLSERCAYSEGVWDETPEDVLRSLTQCTVLCSSLVSVIASRLLAKSEALGGLRKNAAKLWQAAAGLQSVLTREADQRHVIVQVAQNVEFNGLALLNANFLTRRSDPAQVVEDRVSLILSALRSGSGTNATGAVVLWKVLVCAASNFSSSEVLEATDRFVSTAEIVQAGEEYLTPMLTICVERWSETPANGTAATVLLSWFLTRLTNADYRETIFATLSSSKADTKKAVVKIVGLLSTRIESVIGGKVPPLEQLLS